MTMPSLRGEEEEELRKKDALRSGFGFAFLLASSRSIRACEASDSSYRAKQENPLLLASTLPTLSDINRAETTFIPTRCSSERNYFAFLASNFFIPSPFLTHPLASPDETAHRQLVCDDATGHFKALYWTNELSGDLRTQGLGRLGSMGTWESIDLSGSKGLRGEFPAWMMEMEGLKRLWVASMVLPGNKLEAHLEFFPTATYQEQA